MAEFKQAPAGASAAQQVMTWVDNRFPATKLYKEHMSEYYAPKNFNFWYFFGSLALLVLVIQIVTGIFLVMHYKPDAALAFASVEYIMRDVPWGWLIRYMHSTGASAFFVVVYLHMFRGLIYGSYRKPRELVWIFGCAIFLCLMAEAFMGYLLPWGQMSYWGAQVIVNLFAAIPFIGPDLALLIRGDYVVGDATLNRFFAFHVIAVPLVLLGPGGGAHHRAARSRLEQPRRRRDQGQEGSEDRHPAGRHPVPPVLHGARHHRRRRVPDDLQRDHLLRAGDGRLLPRVQQLHPGRPAEDAGAHRAGVVLHAVLLDAARDHRPDGQRAGRASSALAGGAGLPASAASRASGSGRRWSAAVVAVVLLKTFDAKFWGVVVMGAAGDHPVLPALARPQPGQVDPLPARAGTSGCTASSSSSSSCSATWASSRRRDIGTLVSQVGTLFYFGFFLLMPWWSRIGTFKPVPDRVIFHAH